MTDRILARFLELEAASPSGRYLDGATPLSYADLVDRVRATALLLADAGIDVGDRVAVCCADPADISVVVLACVRAGVAAVVLDAGGRPAELAAVLERADVQALFADASVASRLPERELLWVVRPSGGGLKARLFAAPCNDQRAFPACLDAFDGAAPAPAVVPDDAHAVILATSGTTGRPKLVPLSRGCLLHQGDTMGEALDVNAGDRVLNLMHPSHVDGVVTGVFLSFWRGSTFVWPGPFSVPELPRILDLVYDADVTHVLCVPTVLTLAMRLCAPIAPFFSSPHLRAVVSTAAPLAPEVWEQFERESGKLVINVYGLSETGNVFFTGPEIAFPRSASIGRPFACEARVVADDGVDVPDGESGELSLRGPSVLRAYLDEDPLPEWFPTGDIVVRRADGTFDLRGRKKHVAIVGGRNVQLEEVEAALVARSEVREAAAVGLPDDAWGERVVAAVVPTRSPLDVAALRAELVDRLSDHKLPRAIVEVADLPRGRSGKVLRDELATRLRDGASDALSSDVESTERSDLLTCVRRLAAQAFGTAEERLRPESAPADTPGWDSMAHLDFVVRLENELDLELDTDDVVAIRSLASAVDVVERVLQR